MAQLHAELVRRCVHPSRAVVLLPFAQLMAEAQRAWLQRLTASTLQAHFVPRFETTSNWSRSLGATALESDDLRLDAARDVLTAASLLGRAGLGEHQAVLAPRVMEAAWSLVRVGAAVLPAQRAGWAASLAPALVAGMADSVLTMEAAAARLACVVALQCEARSSEPPS